MRKASCFLALVLAVCALATSASAAIGGPGVPPDVRVASSRSLR